MNTYETTFGNDSAADALPEERARFIRKTYLHLAAAILAFLRSKHFCSLPARLIQIIVGDCARAVRCRGLSFWARLWAFRWLASSWANSQTSKGMQYVGLALYVVASDYFRSAAVYGGEFSAAATLLLKPASSRSVCFSDYVGRFSDA
jgi:hypothetical protein